MTNEEIIAEIEKYDETGRMKLFELLRESWCMKCGAEGPESRCYCDYNSPACSYDNE